MRAILVLVAVAVVAARTASACTEAVLKDKCTGGATVSSRTLSFPTSLDPQISYVKAGAALALSEVAGTADKPVWANYPGKQVQSKFNFMCASVARNQLAAYYGAKSARSKENWLWCVDGLNDAGLSCAIQYQGLTNKMPKFNADDKKKPDALNYEDLCTFTLARFETSSAIQKYINDGGNLQLVFPAEIYGKWANVMAQGKHDVPPWHFSIVDRSGRGIVVQVRDGQVQALDNKWGVFTNEPFFEEHEKYTADFEKKMLSNPPDVYPSVKAVMVPELEGPSVFAAGADDKVKFLPLPGDYSGPSRFARMALTLKYAVNPTCWDATSMLNKEDKETLNPAYVPAGAPSINQALLAVMGISNQVYLPRGLDDHGKAGNAAEWTPFQTLRDHKLMTYYVRAANSPLYRQYNLKTINWSNTGESGIVTVPLTTPGETWFVKEQI